MSMVFFTDTGATIGSTSTQDGNALLTDLNQSKFGLRTNRRSQGVYGAGERLQSSLTVLKQLIDYAAPRTWTKTSHLDQSGLAPSFRPGHTVDRKIQAGAFQ